MKKCLIILIFYLTTYLLFSFSVQLRTYEPYGYCGGTSNQYDSSVLENGGYKNFGRVYPNSDGYIFFVKDI